MASSSAHMYIDVQPCVLTESQPAIPLDTQLKGPAASQFQTTTTTHPRDDVPAPQTADYHDRNKGLNKDVSIAKHKRDIQQLQF